MLVLPMFIMSIVGIGFIIAGFAQLSLPYYQSSDVVLYFFIGILIFLCIYLIYKKTTIKGSEEYLNTNNDGIYSITTSISGKPVYRIEIDVNNRLMSLESEGRNKMYSFDEIISFEYESHESIFRSGYSQVDFARTAYLIKTTDLANPVWKFKFAVDGNASLQGSAYYNKLADLYAKWHQIINAAINNNAR